MEVLLNSRLQDYRKSEQFNPTQFNVYHDYHSRLWVVGRCSNPGDHIYRENFSPVSTLDSQGFWTRTFKLDDVGLGTLTLTRPIKASSQDLLEFTEVDLTDQHLSFVVIGTEIMAGTEATHYVKQMRGVLYSDHVPRVGKFNRGMEMLETLVKSHRQNLSLYQENWELITGYTSNEAFA